MKEKLSLLTGLFTIFVILKSISYEHRPDLSNPCRFRCYNWQQDWLYSRNHASFLDSIYYCTTIWHNKHFIWKSHRCFDSTDSISIRTTSVLYVSGMHSEYRKQLLAVLGFALASCGFMASLMCICADSWSMDSGKKSRVHEIRESAGRVFESCAEAYTRKARHKRRRAQCSCHQKVCSRRAS